MINGSLNYFDRNNFEKLRNTRDIENNDDLYLLVVEFCKKLLSDLAMALIFINIVKIQPAEHLPVLVTF
jgi:hemoglobin